MKPKSTVSLVVWSLLFLAVLAGAPAAWASEPREADTGQAAPPSTPGADDGRSKTNATHGEQPSGPWRIAEALSAPRWIRIGLTHRARVEHLRDEFRPMAPRTSTALSLRTQVSVELKFAPLAVFAELMDSRAYATDDTPLNTTIVDAMDILQAYVGLRHEGLFATGDSVAITLGRFTMDVGSRRLVARNEFRNTINSFTGVDVRWSSPGRHALRTFAVLPVRRLPSDLPSLADNHIELDRESTDSLFWGAFFASAPLVRRVEMEAYVFGLHERDDPQAPSANRRIFTPGLRLLCGASPGQLDFQAEAMLQIGVSRASAAPTATRDLTHRAASMHASVGYQLAVAWTPRFVVQYDFASGDRDPGDHVNGRFDPLFGARRFELGPAGLYGAAARSNLSSPGLRVELAPHRAVDAFAGYRLLWLASSHDSWTTAGVQDPSGRSGAFLGHQVEGRVRWHVLPNNLALELGAARLMRGEFTRRAPGARGGSPALIYAQVTGTI